MTAYTLLTDREIRYYPADAADALQRARQAVEELRLTVAALTKERDETLKALYEVGDSHMRVVDERRAAEAEHALMHETLREIAEYSPYTADRFDCVSMIFAARAALARVEASDAKEGNDA